MLMGVSPDGTTSSQRVPQLLGLGQLGDTKSSPRIFSVPGSGGMNASQRWTLSEDATHSDLMAAMSLQGSSQATLTTLQSPELLPRDARSPALQVYRQLSSSATGKLQRGFTSVDAPYTQFSASTRLGSPTVRTISRQASPVVRSTRPLSPDNHRASPTRRALSPSHNDSSPALTPRMASPGPAQRPLTPNRIHRQAPVLDVKPLSEARVVGVATSGAHRSNRDALGVMPSWFADVANPATQPQLPQISLQSQQTQPAQPLGPPVAPLLQRSGTTLEQVQALVDSKFAKVYDVVNKQTGKNDDRLSTLEADRLEKQRVLQQLQQGLEGQRQQLVTLLQSRAVPSGKPEANSLQGDMLNILDGLRDEFEALARQHQWALGAISAQREQHEKFQAAIEELRNKFNESLASHQTHIETVVGEETCDPMKKDLFLLKEQGSTPPVHKELRDLEAIVNQQVDALRAQQQNDVFMLRQKVEQMRALESVGDHMQQLQARQEELARSQEALEATVRSDVLKAVEGERQVRESEIGELAAFMRAEHYARTRDAEKFSQAAQASTPKVDEAERERIICMIEDKMHEEREARKELVCHVDKEKADRVDGLQAERELRTRESSEMRSQMHWMQEKIAQLDEYCATAGQSSKAEFEAITDRRINEMSTHIQAVASEGASIRQDVQAYKDSLEQLIKLFQHDRDQRSQDFLDFREVVHQMDLKVNEVERLVVGTPQKQLQALQEQLTHHLQQQQQQMEEQRAGAGPHFGTDDAKALTDNMRRLWIEVDGQKKHVDDLVIELSATREDLRENLVFPRQLENLAARLSAVEAVHDGTHANNRDTQVTSTNEMQDGSTQLVESLKSEVMERTSQIAELHNRITKETTDINKHVEVATREIMELLESELRAMHNTETSKWQQGGTETSATIDKCDQLSALIENVSTDLCELARALQTEYDGRLRECAELRTQLVDIQNRLGLSDPLNVNSAQHTQQHAV